MYGFGLSQSPCYPLTVDDYAEGVEEVLRNLNVTDVLVVGHSFGGRVALKLAKKSNRTSGLILTDSAGLKPRRKLKYYISVILYKINKAFGRSNAKAGSTDYQNLIGVMKKTFVNVVNEELSACAKAVNVPTLLIWGSEDKETPIYMYKRFLKLIDGAKGIVYEGCGHFPYAEKPKRFADDVYAFASEVLA